MDFARARQLTAAVSATLASLGMRLAKSLFAVLVVCITVASLVWTASYYLKPGPYREHGITYYDPFWVTLPAALVTAGVIALADRLAVRFGWAQASLRRTVCYIVFAQSLTWTFMSMQVPWADMDSTMRIATQLASGRTTALHRGEYLTTYPFQVGLVAYFQALATVFGDWTLYAVKILNAWYIALTVSVLSRIADHLWRSRRVTRVFLFICVLFAPLAMHGVQVYGDSPGRLLGAVAILCTLKYLHGRNRWWMAGAWASLGLGCIVRTNLVIFAVAIAAVLLVDLLRRVSLTSLVAGLAMAVVTLPATGVQAAYESYYDVDFGDGLPTVTWFAMGISEGNHDAGWYSGRLLWYWDTSEHDARLTSAMSEREIEHRIRDFKADPAMAGDFYRRKFVSQWADPDFEATRLSTLQPALSGRRSEFAFSMLYGSGHWALWDYLDGLQSLLGVSAVVWTVRRVRRATLSQMLPGIVLLGGALFHMLWEAKARYAFEYYPYLVLYSAAGLTWMFVKIHARWRLRRLGSHAPTAATKTPQGSSTPA